MNDPTSIREALIIDAIGEASTLLETAQSLAPVLQEAVRELGRANASLRDGMAAFEVRMTALTESAKVQAARHIASRASEVAAVAFDQHRQAMADAARTAFAAELGNALQRLHAALRVQPDPLSRWKSWLTHVAAAATASVVTWILAVMP